MFINKVTNFCLIMGAINTINSFPYVLLNVCVTQSILFTRSFYMLNHNPCFGFFFQDF